MSSKIILSEEQIEFLKFAYPNKDFTRKEIKKLLEIDDRELTHLVRKYHLKRPKEKIPRGYRKCAKCGVIAPIEDFYGNQSYCKSCTNVLHKENKSVEMRTCTVCHKEKPITEFDIIGGRKNSNYRRHQCKDCKYAMAKKQRLRGEY